MNTPNETKQHFVVLWNFELEESGEVVREGVVFSDVEAAKKEASARFIAELDNDFGSRVKPVWSARLKSHGYVSGEVAIRAVTARGLSEALREALAGKGEEVF